jgi:hypothetical protein
VRHGALDLSRSGRNRDDLIEERLQLAWAYADR